MEQKHNRIIVLDDEQDVVDSIVAMLSFKGYDTAGETNPRQLLERIKTEHYDVIISDFRMPELSGIEVAQEVKKVLPESDVIIITAYGTMEVAIDALRYGVYDFILKPFKFEELIHALDRALERQALKRENEQLRAERERHLHELTTLYEINEIVLGSRSLDEVLSFALDTMTESLKLASGAVLLETNGDGIFRTVKATGVFKEPDAQLVIDLSDSSIAEVMEPDGVSLLEGDVVNQVMQGVSAAEAEIRSLLAVPLMATEELTGFLVIGNSEGEEFVGDDKLKLVKVLANQVSPLIRLLGGSEDEEEGCDLTDRFNSIVESAIKVVEPYNGTVSFLCCAVFPLDQKRIPGRIFKSASSRCADILNAMLEGRDCMSQIGLGVFLVTLFGKSKINSELFGLDLKNRLTAELSESEKDRIQFGINLYVYPEDGETAEALTDAVLLDLSGSLLTVDSDVQD